MNNTDPQKLHDLRAKKTDLDNRFIDINNRLLTETNLADILRLVSQKRAIAERIKEISYRITLITN